MKDFYNSEIEAIWICKICYKWLSKDSLIEEKNWIICKKWKCKEELQKINEVIEFNSKTIKKYKNWKSNLIGVLFLILMWLWFALSWIYNYFEYKRMDYFSLFMWILFIWLWVYNYFYSKSLKK